MLIYCVEDDPGIRELTVYTLSSTGFEAKGFDTGESFWAAMERSPLPDLVLLDVMLPGNQDGVALLRRMRAQDSTRSIPVIMATAKGAEYDKVQALDCGADDYMVKPYGMMELVSRVKAVLRRSQPRQTPLLTAGDLTLDISSHTLTVAGQEVSATLKEFELLRHLLEHRGQVFTRDALLSQVWGYDFDGETRTVDVHIRSLRQKLEGSGVVIDTVRGVGYRLGVKK